MSDRSHRGVVPFLLAISSLSSLPAQCAPVATPHATNQEVAAIAPLPGGRILVGGWFNNQNGVNHVGVYDRATQTWDTLGGGCNGPIYAVARLPNGDLVAGGHFAMAGSTAVDNIARWDGQAWHAMVAGTSGGMWTPGVVYSLLVLPNGDLLAGGDFAQMGGVAAPNLARWNGVAWTSMGYPFLVLPYALTLMPNGDLIVGADYQVDRWDGTTWSVLGSTSGWVTDLAVLADGSLVVSGSFTHMDSASVVNIARWQGGVWSGLGLGLNARCEGLASLPDGGLLAAGNFTSAVMSSQSSVAVDRIARWNGTQWSPFSSSNGFVLAIARNDDDSYTLGGAFSTIAGTPASRLATIASGCPAAAAAFGVGCPSSVGPVTLASTARPWLGATYAARATGLPAAAFGVGVYGFAPAALPLAPVLPAAANCFLFSTADALEVLLPSAGAVTSNLAVPVHPALVGVTLRHQVLAFELGGSALVDVSASNGLLLTIGVL